MKARYSAFATAKTLGDIAIDFLWNTWAPDKGSKGDEAEIKNWALSCKWLSLNIDNTYQGAKGDSYGEVVFTARYKQQGRLLIHNEHSVFRHVDGQWLYVAHLPVQPET